MPESSRQLANGSSERRSVSQERIDRIDEAHHTTSRRSSLDLSAGPPPQDHDATPIDDRDYEALSTEYVVDANDSRMASGQEQVQEPSPNDRDHPSDQLDDLSVDAHEQGMTIADSPADLAASLGTPQESFASHTTDTQAQEHRVWRRRSYLYYPSQYPLQRRISLW